MIRIHRKDVTDGRDAKLVLVRQIQTVQAIDELGTIGHRHFFRVAIKDVQCHSAEDGISQGRYLLKLVGRRSFAAGPVPWSPFVDHEFDAVLRIEFAHDLPMSGDKALHAVALAQQFVPVDGFELEGISLALHPILRGATAQIPGIVVKGHAVDGAQLPFSFLEDLFQKTTRPVPIIHIRTRGDEGNVLVVVRHPGSPAAKFDGVFLRREVSAASPTLVADTPVTDIEGLGEPGGSSHVGECCAARRRIAVFDPAIEIPGAQTAHVSG